MLSVRGRFSLEEPFFCLLARPDSEHTRLHPVCVVYRRRRPCLAAARGYLPVCRQPLPYRIMEGLPVIHPLPALRNVVCR
jgi:hypothetical protein